MTSRFNERAEQERRRWMRENAHLYWRPDAHRFMWPDAERFNDRWRHPDHKLWNPNFRYREEPQPHRPRAAASAVECRAAERGEQVRRSRPSTSEILKLKSDLAALRVQHAVIRHEIAIRQARGLPSLRESDAGWQLLLKGLARFQADCRKAGFDPDQPRVPAGNPEGGRWTSQGGVSDPRVRSDATPDNTWIPDTQYAENESERASLLNKHIIDDHVNKTDAELVERIRREQVRGPFVSVGTYRNGSFDSVESARDLIGRTIENNPESAARVASGQSTRELLTWRFGYETGREAYLDQPDGEIQVRKTYNVGVVIAHDPASSIGYRVITAYPRNYNPRIGR